MRTSKLFTLLRGLRPDEVHWFQKLLNSPFFNNNTLPSHLFSYLKKYLPELDSPKLSKEKIFQKLFPNEKFNVQKLRKVMFELASLVEEFFVTMRLRNEKFQKKKILVEELGERNLYKQFEKGTKELLRELESLPYRDTFFYKEIYELNLNYSAHPETNRQKLNLQIFKISTDHLDYFYLLQKLQLNFAVKLGEKLLKNKVKINSLKQAQSELQKEPVFILYELINETVSKSDNEKHYAKIEMVFKNEMDRLGKKDKIIILKILLNFSSSQINKGNSKYFSKMLSHYKFGLEQNLLIENKQISETTFTNIITVGSNEKEFSWVEQFIENYKKYLPNSVREDATCFGLGLMFYQKKNYSKTIDLILKHSFSKPLHIMQSKTILLRAYVDQYLIDQSYYELLISQTHTFEKFIRRNELISEIKKERYLNFVLFTRRIANAHWQKKVDKELLKKLKNTESVLLKFWLINIIENVLKK